MLKNKWLFVAIVIILISLQIGIMSNCLSQAKAFGFFGCTELIDDSSHIQDKAILSIQSDDSLISMEVEIADEPQEQAKGLMFRENLNWNDGMLFVFESERKQSFWMKNTRIPLDMLFIDKDFRIIEIKENIQPCKTDSCPSYPSKFPAKYVLEVNAGFTAMNKIKIGDSVMWEIKR